MIEENKITTEHYEKLVKVLGEKNVPGKIESPFDFIHIAGMGINVSVIRNFSDYFNLTKTVVAQLLDISEPTLFRWTKSNKNL